jgi:voltage-gated potassium channel Kch
MVSNPPCDTANPSQGGNLLYSDDVSNDEVASVIICGLGRFGIRVVECVREQSPSASITVITAPATRADRIRRIESLGAHTVFGDFRFAETRAEAGIKEATSLIFCAPSDTDNLAAALDARGEAPHLRILIRLDEGRFAQRLMQDFGIDLALSPAALAAQEFCLVALEPMPDMLPPKLERDVSPRRKPAASPLPQRFRLPPPYDTRRPLILLAILLMTLFLAGVEVFQQALHLPLVDAIYFTATIITTVGFGDYNLLKESPALKLFGTVLMFGGVMLVALLTSFITNFFLSGAASELRNERMAKRAQNHLIVCGLGTVGFEVVRMLSEQKTPMVIIDDSPDSNAVRLLAGRIPIIQGDASSESALLRAGVLRARSIIACLSDDAKNLEIGLTVQTLMQERQQDRRIRIVLRCFDAELARRIRDASTDYILLSSADIAAPIFAQVALKSPTLSTAESADGVRPDLI